MTPNNSEFEFKKHLGMPLNQLNARAGVGAMLSFYAGHRTEGVMEEQDGDMLLVQWGTYSFSGPPTFQLNITRQFILPDENEPQQLSLTFHYDPIDELKSIKPGNHWCHSLSGLNDFRHVIAQLPALAIVEQLQPLRAELSFSRV